MAQDKYAIVVLVDGESAYPFGYGPMSRRTAERMYPHVMAAKTEDDTICLVKLDPVRDIRTDLLDAPKA